MSIEAKKLTGCGRRKCAVARVRIAPASDGKMLINGREPMEYFRRETSVQICHEPLVVAGREGAYQVSVNVRGGGLTGQAGAVRHGLARAIARTEPELRTALKRAGLLTRDARVVERKKYGQKGARRRFQFSKR
jgi:small subunit ribosomal protein S9